MITPVFFVSSGVSAKHLIVNKGFDSFKLSFLSYAFVGFFLFCILVYQVITDPEVSTKLLAIGTFGSIINTVGIVLIIKANSIGPLGPVNALSSISTIMFSAVQAFRFMKMPSYLEFIGMFVGIIGSLVLTIPDHMHRLLKGLTCRD